MTPQEITAFITLTANIVSKDMSSEEIRLLVVCLRYLADTLSTLAYLDHHD